jgi:hypothetical protein
MARRAPAFEWEGVEYEHHERGGDWYWALGIITIAGIIAALLFGNYLLAVLILAAAGALALHAAKKPPVHQFRLTDDGLLIGADLHPYGRMRSFAILEYIEGDMPPVLSIKTEHWFAPHLLIPLNDVDADLVYDYLLDRVDEGDHPPTLADLVAGWMGF